MDHIKILKRAFEITRYYRVLWIFGILLALTTAGSNGAPNSRVSVDRSNFNPPPINGFDVPRDWNFNFPAITSQLISTLIAIGIGLACLVILLAIAGTVVRYVSETALIRMVNSYEDSGEKVSARQGLRLGWSRGALRIFLIDLLIFLVSIAVFLGLMLVAVAPLLVWLTGSRPLQVVGTVATIGLGLLVVFLIIIVAIILSLLLHFIRRACVLEELGVIESIKRGIALVRQRIGDVVIMGIIMFALGFAYILLMIPVVIMLVLVGVVVAGLPALLVGGLAGIFLRGPTPWIIAAVIGLPLFILVIAAPSLFLSGLMETFRSSTWTLTYRELIAMEALKAEMPKENTASETDHPAEGEGENPG
jgi:hypothetical protein